MATINTAVEKAAIVITPFHNDMFAILNTGLKASKTMHSKLLALVKTKHSALPTFEAYSLDCDALAQLVRDKGLSAESDHFHKAYRAALVELFGAIPVSMANEARRKYDDRLTPEQKTVYDKALSEAQAAKEPAHAAVAKAVRAVKTAKSQKVQDTAGAPKGEVKDQKVSKDESIEQLVARVGMFPLLDAIVKTLNAVKATQGKAKALAQLTAQLTREMKPAEKKAA
jgi:hypothetical protein